MFGYVANNLTQKSNDLIDWSRIGELASSRHHRYSKHEIIVRGSIVLFTASCSFVAAYFNDQEKTGCASSTLAIAMGAIGFVVSHGIVIYPLYQKRVAMQAECNACATKIRNQFCTHPDDGISQAVENIIVAIMKLSLGNETRSNASQTWGHRLSLLHKLERHLESLSSDTILKFYVSDNVNSVINELENIDLTTECLRTNAKSR